MDDDIDLINSPLEREVTRDGFTVSICIYRGPEEAGWVLEVEDHLGGSTVWDERFDTDEAALDEAMRTIETEGIRSFTRPDDRVTRFFEQVLRLEVRSAEEAESGARFEVLSNAQRIAALEVVAIEDEAIPAELDHGADDAMRALSKAGFFGRGGLRDKEGESRIAAAILGVAPKMLARDAPRILAIVSEDSVLTTRDLKDVLQGMLPTLNDDTKKELRGVREKIDLYLWFDEQAGFKANAMTTAGRHLRQTLQGLLDAFNRLPA